MPSDKENVFASVLGNMDREKRASYFEALTKEIKDLRSAADERERRLLSLQALFSEEEQHAG